MFFNPIIAMLHNTKENRWHPILFCESPLPGPHSPDKPIRHKSKMHHTTGFLTREEAVTDARTVMANAVATESDCPAKFALEKDFEWDGEGIPAMVTFFGELDGVLQPLL